MKFVISLIVFILTLISIIIKPFRKKEAFYALFFALWAFLLGLVSIKDAVFVISNIWNAVFSLIAIMIISLILDEAGFFKWMALSLALAAEGSKKKLFILTVVLGAVVSVFFNNDGSILILTPIVYEMTHELGFRKEFMLPFMFACGFIADTASVPLVVSNLANMVNADTLKIGFNYYTSRMLLPGIGAIIIVTAALYVYFKDRLLQKYSAADVANPDDAVKDWKIFNMGILILLLVIVGYFTGSAAGIPVSFISSAGALTLVLYCKRRKTLNIKEVLKRAPWVIIAFAFGMYVVVYGLYINGLNQIMQSLLFRIAASGKILQVIYSGAASTFTACAMNNLPSVMTWALSVREGSLNEATKQIIAFSSVIGNDIGAKLTPVGSLATIMWMDILKIRGVEITYKEYMKTALFVITPVILLSLLILGLVV
jgi:arsenical pump membrane protein